MKTKPNNNANAGGYVKFWRAVLNVDGIGNNAPAVALYVRLLVRANITPDTFEGISIERGQLATGIRSLAEQSGLTERATRTALQTLENAGLIKRVPARRGMFSVVTCCNYDDCPILSEQANAGDTPNDTPNDTPTDTATTHQNTPANNYNSIDCGDVFGTGDTPTAADVTHQTTHKATTSKEIKEIQETCICINTDFENLQNWIRKNAPTIKEIPQQLTPAQFDTLTGDGYTFEQIRDVIAEIANYNGAGRRYRSVYLTARNWLKRDRERATESGTPATRSATRSRSTDATPSHGLHRNPNRGDFDATHNTGGILRKPANRGK